MSQYHSALGQLEETLDVYLVKKAPALPAKVKEILVQFAPWLVIISIILALPAVFVLLGAGAVVGMMMPYAPGYAAANFGWTYTVSTLVLGVSLVLNALAVPGLFARQKSAWNLVFYAQIVSAVSQLLTGNVIGMIIGALIGLYLLFQVRSAYK